MKLDGFEELLYVPEDFNPSPMWQSMIKKGVSKIYQGHTIVSYHYSDGILVLGIHRFGPEEGTGSLPLSSLRDLGKLINSQDKVILLSNKDSGPVRKWMDKNGASYIKEHQMYIKGV